MRPFSLAFRLVSNQCFVIIIIDDQKTLFRALELFAKANDPKQEREEPKKLY